MTTFRFLPLGLLSLIVLGLAGCEAERPMSFSWQVEETHRWAELPEASGAEPGFRRLDSTDTGIGFVNTLSADQYLENRHLVNGSGVAVGDVTGDGWPDLYLARLDGPNVLYENEGGGTLRFEQVSQAGGAALPDQFSTGAVLEDVTGNGRVDLLVTTLGGPNLVFENKGEGQFAAPDTLHAGRGSTTMALADVNGNGALDLYVANYKDRTIKDVVPPSERRFDQVVQQEANGSYRVRDEFEEDYEVRRQGNRLMRFEIGETDRIYFNDGEGTFAEQEWTSVFRGTEGAAATESPRDWALVARLEDLNGDGTPDLYVCNDFESPDFYYRGMPGEGRFREAPEEALRTTSHSSMSIATTDVERNGTDDFFVADMLGKSYERRQQQVGVGTPIPRNVGDETKRMQEMLNTLQTDRGDGTYVQHARLAGVDASGWTWATSFVDVNLDGYEDLLAVNGHAYDAMHADTQMRLRSRGGGRAGVWRKNLLRFPDLDQKNAAFRNEGDGTFRKMADGWGLGKTADVSHGMATGDFDGDGDLDVVINRLNRPVGVYRNEGTGPRVAVRLAGRSPNTGGIGAEVEVEPEGGSVPAQETSVIAGGEYVSDSGGTLAFAMGEAEAATIRVEWPTGEETEIEGAAGRIYEVKQPGAEPGWETPAAADSGQGQSAEDEAEKDQPAGTEAGAGTPPDSTAEPWFEEVSQRLSHQHTDTKYQDFQRQPLLSKRQSQEGPGAAWVDLDGDGDEDLVVGTGRGGELAYFRNDGDGDFARVQGGDLDQSYSRDLTGIVGVPTDEGATLFVGKSNYERQPDDPANPSEILVFEADETGLREVDRLPFGSDAVGPLALADVDGDGDLDLFAGGRLVPGRYPVSASSALYLNQNGEYRRDASRSRRFEDVGLISGASFADVNGNGHPDLVLATEWGAIQYFRNQGNGRFVDRTEEAGLDAYTGLWNGVSVGDFTGNGKLDLVATNWGWNSRYGRPEGAPKDIDTPLLEHPLRVYYADFDQNGSMDVIETHYHSRREEYLPYSGLSTMGEALPYLRRRVSSFEQYSQSSLSEIIGARRFGLAETKEATTVSHMVFLNRGSADGVQFEGQALPWWAQLTAAFAPSVADLTGDGHQDLLLSQNFFATEVSIPRQDGGRALLLRGNGTGQFEPIKGHHSGVIAYGEQRAAPLADVDGDGRVDVLVTQNGARTRLFRNERAEPGLAVRLEAPGENRRAVGATVRLRYENGERGPVTPVTAGTSYWSQHSLTPVLGSGEHTVEAVEVVWPNGTSSETAVAADVRSVTLQHPDR